jgi:transcriptional regulator GlxA family with amidase domain
MDRAPQEDWPVTRLAAISAVSPAHFARSFRQAFGLPPHRYLLTRRIERAAALLDESRASITDIAFQTGWQSIGSFGRVFRDVTGDSPGGHRTRDRQDRAAAGAIPECLLRAARRPDLKSAVLEKRRRVAPDDNGAPKQEAT